MSKPVQAFVQAVLAVLVIAVSTTAWVRGALAEDPPEEPKNCFSNCNMCIGFECLNPVPLGGCLCSVVYDQQGFPIDCWLTGSCAASPPCPDCQVDVPIAAPGIPSGNFNGDSYKDFPIGLPGRSTGGQVHIFHGSSGGYPSLGSPSQTWDRDSAGMLGVAAAYDNFGIALAIGNFNGDSYDDLAIGVPGDDDGPDDSGSIHVLYGSSSGLTADGDQIFHQDTTGIEGARETDDHFGAALAVGDVDCDGYDDLLIGVPDEAIGSDAQAGLFHVIYGSSGGLTATGDAIFHQDSSGIGDSAEPGDRYGMFLASGNFDNNTVGGNGCDDVAVAAWGEDLTGGTDAGLVNVLYGGSSGLTSSGSQLFYQGANGIAGSPENGDGFGDTLRVAYYNSDSYADLLYYVAGDELLGMIPGSSSGLTGASDITQAGMRTLGGFPLLECYDSGTGGTTCECNASNPWSAGTCEWFSHMCDAVDLDYLQSGSDQYCSTTPFGPMGPMGGP